MKNLKMYSYNGYDGRFNSNRDVLMHVNNSDEHLTTAVNEVTDAVNLCTASNREINNSANSINNESINIEFPSRIEVPKVKEIVIKSPKAEGRSRPPVQEKKPKTFEF